MAKIDELLKELCPDGVEYVSLGSICNCITGGDTPKDCIKGQKEPTAEYPYPVYSNGDAVYGYCKTYRVDKSAVTVSSIGNVGTAFYRTPFFTPIIRLKTFIPNEDSLDVKFLYFCLSGMDFIGTNSSLSSMKAADFKKIQIPLPPLPIQQHIVEVLDTFTDAISNLEEELALREKQFEYYREQLLAFDDEDIDKAELSSISDIKGRIGFRGYTRNDIVDKGAGAISLSPSNIVDGMLHFENSTYISWEKYEESPEIKASEGQIVLTKTGSTVGKVALIKYLPEPCTINPQLVLITCTTFNSAYLNYVLQSFSMQSEIKRLAGIGAVPNISQKLLGKIIVPIPSSERQQEIVEILDTFEAMIVNIKEEIALRTKQYEYYREKLLSFGK